MKRWLMDMIACPVVDCRGKLNLEVFSSHTLDVDGEEIEEIDEALLTCTKCGRWYPVIDRITCMMQDEDRLEGRQYKEEKAFLERWREKIPQDLLEKGIPFGLES